VAQLFTLGIYAMWVKRTEQELEAAKQEAKRERRFFAIVLGGIACLGFTCLHGKYWRRHGYTSAFVSLDEVPDRLPFSIAGGVIVGLLFYWCKPASRKTVICPHCDKSKFDDGVTRCSCGRDFEDIKTLIWK
jgi:hypothetical protein